MRNLTLWLVLSLFAVIEAASSYQLRPRSSRSVPPLPTRSSGRLSSNLYSLLRGEVSQKEQVKSYLEANVPFPIDSELFVILKEYLEWSHLDLFDLLSQRISFEGNLRELISIADAAAGKDERYFRALITNQASFIYRNLKEFWSSMIQKYGSCHLNCLIAADWLQKALPACSDIKNSCSFYLLNGLFEIPEKANRVEVLLNSDCIDPNCTVSPLSNSEIKLPFVYSLLNCNDRSRPSHYYSCFFNCPRVDINCIIPAVSLLGHDLEDSNEIQVCALPFLYHSLILINFEAFFHLATNARLNGRQVLLYLPRFIYWILSNLLLQLRKR